MTTTTQKHKVFSQVFTALGKGGRAREAAPRKVLEQFLYAICREGTTREAADSAYRALEEKFYDWNEIRVSSPRELADVLAEFVTDSEARAQRLIEFLHEVFETTFSFDLEALQKKGFKQAAKQLARYQAANDYAVAWVVQQSLGGHSIPLDENALRVLRRLGLIEDGENDLEALRASLEHQVPKARGTEFVDLISAVAVEHCWEEDPACPMCPLHKRCPTGMDMKAASVSASTKKPR